MFKALSLIRNPETGWERITHDRQNFRLVFLTYFIPVLLLAAVVEGLGMIKWRTLNAGVYGAIHFNLNQVVVFEVLHLALMLVGVLTCAYFVWLLREPFYGRYNYREALMVVMYSFSPLILCWMLDGIPKVNLWISWGFGIYFSLKIFYHGIRFISRTDPGSATVLFFLSSGIIISLTGAQRYMLAQCLTGPGASINSAIVGIAAKLPF